MDIPKHLEHIPEKEKKILMEFKEKGFTWKECQLIVEHRLGKKL